MLRCALLLLSAVLLSAYGSQEFRQLQAERQAALQQHMALTRKLLASSRVRPSVPAPQFTRPEQARGQAATLPGSNPNDITALQRQLQIQTEFALALRPPLEQARRQSGLQALAQQFNALDNRMRVARQRYQLATRRHNQLLASFPSGLTARAQGLQPQALLAGLP